MIEPFEIETAMKIGFSGTRKGMTSQQKQVMECLLSKLPKITFAHHGDCIGADAEFHQACLNIHIAIVIHPPSDNKNRANCIGFAEEMPPAPYLERDRRIVDSTELLIATPAGKEHLRSGTWTTIRYARKRKKPVIIIEPDGSLACERSTWEELEIDKYDLGT